MARGNQRDLAREKNAKKQKEMSKKQGADQKGTNKGMSLTERKQRDAEIMKQKLQKAAEAKKTETT